MMRPFLLDRLEAAFVFFGIALLFLIIGVAL
jgi:hypothetical protein